MKRLILLALLGIAIAINVIAWTWNNTPWLGVDFHLFREFGHRWLDTGSMYLPQQLSGPYSVWHTQGMVETPSMYPPAIGPLFGLLALLPMPVAVVAWWGIPLGIVAWALWRWRPALWAVVLMLFLLPFYPIQFVVGGSVMWALALVTLGLMYHWPAALLLLKPTLAPFALIGIRDWRWWAVVAGIMALTLAGPWRDWITAIGNGTDSGGLGYSLDSYPLLLLPVLAYLTRVREPNPVKNHPGESLYVAEASA